MLKTFQLGGILLRNYYSGSKAYEMRTWLDLFLTRYYSKKILSIYFEKKN